eukprot:scaffold1042_cov401-Prasinococcus_capsulatus_cf.AAC.47
MGMQHLFGICKLRTEAYEIGCKYRGSLQRLKALLESNQETRATLTQQSERIAQLKSCHSAEIAEATRKCQLLQEENEALEEHLARVKEAALKAERAEVAAVKRLEEMEEEHARAIETRVEMSEREQIQLEARLLEAANAAEANCKENEELQHLLLLAEEDKAVLQTRLEELKNMLETVQEEMQAQLRSHQGKIDGMSEEKTRLLEEKNKLEELGQQTKQTLERTEARAIESEMETESLRRKVVHLESELSNISQEHEHLQTCLQTERSKAKELRSRIEQTTFERLTEEADARELRLRLHEVETDMEALEKKTMYFDAMQEANRQMAAEVQDTTLRNKQLTAQLEELQRRAGEREGAPSSPLSMAQSTQTSPALQRYGVGTARDASPSPQSSRAYGTSNTCPLKRQISQLQRQLHRSEEEEEHLRKTLQRMNIEVAKARDEAEANSHLVQQQTAQQQLALQQRLRITRQEYEQELWANKTEHAAAIARLELQIDNLRAWQGKALREGTESDEKCRALARALTETQNHIETVTRERDAAVELAKRYEAKSQGAPKATLEPSESYLDNMSKEQYREAYSVVKQCHAAAMDAARGVATRLAVQKDELQQKVENMERKVLEVRSDRSNMKRIIHALKKRLKKYEGDKTSLLGDLRARNVELKAQIGASALSGPANIDGQPPETRHGLDELRDQLDWNLRLLHQLHQMKNTECIPEDSVQTQTVGPLLVQQNAMLRYALYLAQATLNARATKSSHSPSWQHYQAMQTTAREAGTAIANDSCRGTGTSRQLVEESEENVKLIHHITLALHTLRNSSHPPQDS